LSDYGSDINLDDDDTLFHPHLQWKNSIVCYIESLTFLPKLTPTALYRGPTAPTTTTTRDIVALPRALAKPAAQVHATSTPINSYFTSSKKVCCLRPLMSHSLTHGNNSLCRASHHSRSSRPQTTGTEHRCYTQNASYVPEPYQSHMPMKHPSRAMTLGKIKHPRPRNVAPTHHLTTTDASKKAARVPRT